MLREASVLDRPRKSGEAVGGDVEETVCDSDDDGDGERKAG